MLEGISLLPMFALELGVSSGGLVLWMPTPALDSFPPEHFVKGTFFTLSFVDSSSLDGSWCVFILLEDAVFHLLVLLWIISIVTLYFRHSRLRLLFYITPIHSGKGGLVLSVRSCSHPLFISNEGYFYNEGIHTVFKGGIKECFFTSRYLKGYPMVESVPLDRVRQDPFFLELLQYLGSGNPIMFMVAYPKYPPELECYLVFKGRKGYFAFSNL
jgi:hypothetical protein